MSKQNINMIKIALIIIFISSYFSPYLFCKEPNNVFTCNVGTFKYNSNLIFDSLWDILIAGAPFILIAGLILIALKIGSILVLKKSFSEIFENKFLNTNFLENSVISFAFISGIFGIIFGFSFLIISLLLGFLISIFQEKESKAKEVIKINSLIVSNISSISEKVLIGFLWVFIFGLLYFLLNQFLVGQKLSEIIFINIFVTNLVLGIFALAFYFSNSWTAPLAIFISTLNNITPGSIFIFLIISSLVKKENLKNLKKIKAISFGVGIATISISTGILLDYVDISSFFNAYKFGDSIFPKIAGEISIGIFVAIFLFSTFRKSYLSIKEELKDLEKED